MGKACAKRKLRRPGVCPPTPPAWISRCAASLVPPRRSCTRRRCGCDPKLFASGCERARARCPRLLARARCAIGRRLPARPAVGAQEAHTRHGGVETSGGSEQVRLCERCLHARTRTRTHLTHARTRVHTHAHTHVRARSRVCARACVCACQGGAHIHGVNQIKRADRAGTAQHRDLPRHDAGRPADLAQARGFRGARSGWTGSR